MVRIVNPTVYNEINDFYLNMHRKFRHSWGIDEIHNLIDNAVDSIYEIENGLQRREPTISRWKGLFMATSRDRKWNFAYRIEEETIYVEDACHAQNMHESKNVIRITESKLKDIIIESIMETIEDMKDSYQAKPKNNGRLNDWELFNILTTIVSNMVNDKRIPKEDGEMLLYYGLYNNDCFTHLDS